MWRQESIFVSQCIEVNRRSGPGGKAAHALMTTGGAEWQVASRSPLLDVSSPAVVFVYVEGVDGAIERAVAQGAKILVELKDQSWSEPTGWIMDPAGHVWAIASRIEKTTEQQRRDRCSSMV